MQGTTLEIGFTKLDQMIDPKERAKWFRAAMGALGAERVYHDAMPFESLEPTRFLASIKIAMSDGLFDQMEYLSPERMAGICYEVAAALPPSEEKRELGRRVLHWLHEGNAQTFVLLATHIASSSRKALLQPAMKARVSVVVELHKALGAQVEQLAMALLTANELREEWYVSASRASLPERKLAARLFEHAVGEAVRRARTKDASALEIFSQMSVGQAWKSLFYDREPLVWRHLASARGVLAEVSPQHEAAITRDLEDPTHPTLYRRGVCSMASTIGWRAELAYLRLGQFLSGEQGKKDPGIAVAVLYGLFGKSDQEPMLTQKLVLSIVHEANMDVLEVVLELLQKEENLRQAVVPSVLQRLQVLSRERYSDDDTLKAWVDLLEADARDLLERRGSLRAQLNQAKEMFLEDSKKAVSTVQQLVGEVENKVRTLLLQNDTSYEQRASTMGILRDLDQALALGQMQSLVMIGAKQEELLLHVGQLGLQVRDWLFQMESAPVKQKPVAHEALRFQRTKVLLHWVDSEHAQQARTEKNDRADKADKKIQAARLLLHRVHEDAPSGLRRMVSAATARAFDALLRDERVEVSDIVLSVVFGVKAEQDIRAMAEASKIEELSGILTAYANMIKTTSTSMSITLSKQTLHDGGVGAFRVLIDALPYGTPRTDALKTCWLALADCVDQCLVARSLTDLTGGEGGGMRESLFTQLGHALIFMLRLVVGAKRRVLGQHIKISAEQVKEKIASVEHEVLKVIRTREAVASWDSGSPDGSGRITVPGLEEAARQLAEELEALNVLFEELFPLQVVKVLQYGLNRTLVLPAVRQHTQKQSWLPKTEETALPNWIPSSRCLGGFYMIRALGTGAGGTVFIAKRAEERSQEDATLFAVKVPEMTTGSARAMSEQEFLQMFREEAGALLSIPQHPNLGKLVTFDAGAKPKPILVMEMVHGPTLERLIKSKSMNMWLAFLVIDGIGLALHTMHEIGVGHLDVKPANVILRGQEGGNQNPVLVDFGLSGRKLRPGCATANYGAPEIWGMVPEGHQPKPQPADVYAYAALVFEALTGKELFEGPNEIAVITQHLQHDGVPEPLAKLGKKYPEILAVLEHGLKQDPRSRLSIKELKEALVALAPHFAQQSWPLS